MSTLDREPRTNAKGPNGPLFEPRINPGVNTLTPERLGPKKLPAKIPRGSDLTGTPGRMPVKR